MNERDIDPFDSPDWTYLEITIWIATRDADEVRDAVARNREPATHREFHTLPDGSQAMVEVAGERASADWIQARMSHPTIAGKGNLDSLDAVNAEWISRARNGLINVEGRRSGAGDLATIPPTAFRRVVVRYENGASELGPENDHNKSATRWTDLTFQRDEIMALWPKPSKQGIASSPPLRSTARYTPIPDGYVDFLTVVSRLIAARHGAASVQLPTIEDDPIGKQTNVIRAGQKIRLKEENQRQEAAKEFLLEQLQSASVVGRVLSKTDAVRSIPADDWKADIAWRAIATGKYQAGRSDDAPIAHGSTLFLSEKDARRCRKQFLASIEGQKPVTVPAKRGRRKGTGSYKENDSPLVQEMHAAILRGDAKSAWGAADAVVDRAVGGGTFESRKKRLCALYSEKFGQT